MTGRAVDGESDWDGPEWAAPESAERIASCPRAVRNGATIRIKLYAHGLIGAEEFHEMARLERAAYLHNRTRAAEGWR